MGEELELNLSFSPLSLSPEGSFHLPLRTTPTASWPMCEFGVCSSGWAKP